MRKVNLFETSRLASHSNRLARDLVRAVKDAALKSYIFLTLSHHLSDFDRSGCRNFGVVICAAVSVNAATMIFLSKDIGLFGYTVRVLFLLAGIMMTMCGGSMKTVFKASLFNKLFLSDE